MMKSYMLTSPFLLMEKQSFKTITISEIVKKAGINHSTYYRHFSTKEETVYYFVEQVLDEFSYIVPSDIDLYHYLVSMFTH